MLRIPVFTTLLGAYAFVWRERRDFLALAFPAIVALAVAITLLARLAAAAGARPDSGRGEGVLGGSRESTHTFPTFERFVVVKVPCWRTSFNR